MRHVYEVMEGIPFFSNNPLKTYGVLAFLCNVFFKSMSGPGHAKRLVHPRACV